ncbi:MAG: DsbA family oxidoreductase [Methylobacterium mesophilicum]|nr:DsbA family oxidoreductase [Methylobacterium mesophilicum]
MTLSINVVSDVVCPWCFLGMRRLDRALAQAPEADTTVHWRPFQLDPSIPAGGLDRREYMKAKFGTGDRLQQTHATLEQLGAAEGIGFHFDAITRSPNTLDAHRLIRWAGAEGEAVQRDVVAELFSRYFEQGQDIGDRDVLADVGAKSGMMAADLRERLAGDEGRESVQAEIVEAQRKGVSGVPFFILADRYAISGAQEAATLADAIRQIAAMPKEA